MKTFFQMMLLLLSITLLSVWTTATAQEESPMMDNYIVKLSDKVVRKPVLYKNRFGIELSGDLYYAKNLDQNKKHSGIVIGAPYGGVKEQGPCVYANELAQRGFVVLTFDPSFYGYSGGSPRNVSSPEIYTEDFSAGIDFLGTREFVDRQKIGTLGICGSGGFSLSAAQIDPRIKAAATVSMYDMSRCIRNGFGDSMTKEQRDAMLKQAAEQRWADFETGRPALDSRAMQLSALTDEKADAISKEFAEFYVQPRGYHHNSLAQHTMTSLPAFANYSLLTHLKDISPRPILLIIGENAHSRYFSEDVYKEAAEPKELFIVPNANHVDLYDRTDKIPFDKIDNFFKTNLK